MGFRTNQMYGTARAFRDAPEENHHAWINNRGWDYQPSDGQAESCYTKELPADAPRPPEAESCVRFGKRMVCFIFCVLVALLSVACLWAAVLPVDKLVCMAGVA